MSNKAVVKRWVDSAHDDWITAEVLFQNKRYAHCLFYCHLVLEKLLKGLFVKNKDTTPRITHNLTKLIRDTGETVPDKLLDDLDEISSFNVEARYDIYKQKLYKKANNIFTQRYFRKTKEIMLWLEKRI